MVFLPGWHTSLRYRGLCDVLFSPRSMIKGVALTETCTDAGQFVFICLSSWWKHLSCSSRSERHIKVWCTVGFSWNTWLLTARLCSRRNGGRIMPSRTGNVSLNSSSSVKNDYLLETHTYLQITQEINEYICMKNLLWLGSRGFISLKLGLTSGLGLM